MIERKTIVTYLDDQLHRGRATQFVHRKGLRTVSWSYEEVALTAYRFARELETRAVDPGARVMLCGRNSPEWVAAFWGCAARGVAVVPVDKDSTPEFFRSVRDETRAELIVGGSDAPSGKCFDVPQLPLEELGEHVSRHSAAPYVYENIDEETIVEIIFTSGTTQNPKGVVLTHRNLLANLLPVENEIAKYIKWERFVRPVRFLNLVPLSHVFGQFLGIFLPQLLGGEVHFQDSLNTAEILRRTRESRISVTVLVPRLLDGLRESIERDYAERGQSEELRKSLASAVNSSIPWRWWKFHRIHRRMGWKFWAFISGGATLDERTDGFWRGLGFAVLQGYGMTETASLISLNHPFRNNRGSVGKLMPDREVRLDDSGEIIVRGASVSPGYWTEDGTVKAHADGWLRTGDIGEMDGEGNLHFKGRKKDVIVTAAGMNIHPEDLESVLNSQPEVRASCVIAWHSARGPEPLAVLILRDKQASALAAIELANRILADYQQIRRWSIWLEPDFPRTATQKVLRREVAARVQAEMETSADKNNLAIVATQGSSTSSFILSEAARISGDAAICIDPSTNLTTDLKLDSLARVELLSAVEDHYQVEINEAAFTAATTLADIEKLVHDGDAEHVAAYPYPRLTRHFPFTWVRVLLFYTIILPITRVMSRMRVKGRENIDKLEGPALYVANHVTLTDHALILAAMPPHCRHRTAIAMDGEILRSWLYPPEGTKWLTRLRLFAQYTLVVLFFHVFPLPKQSGFRRSFGYAAISVDRGENVLVFPEGERAPRGQMKMSAFKTGIGLLAKELNVPVVPMKLEGLYELKLRRQYFAQPGMITVIIGKPIRFHARAEAVEIAAELERSVASL